MKKIIVVAIGFFVLVGIVEQTFCAKKDRKNTPMNQSATSSQITQVINDTDVDVIITSPFMMHDDIFIAKNISLINQEESTPEKILGYKNSLIIPAQTCSLVSNLKFPHVDVSVTIPENFRLRPNNYNPGTMQAVCFHVPPQSFSVNYTLVHKPLPVFALRQKGEELDIVFGEGMHEAIMPDDKKMKNDTTYTVEIHQRKPIEYLQNVRHETHELYDLSTMYLDGGAQVAPLQLNQDLLDIVIRKNNRLVNE